MFENQREMTDFRRYFPYFASIDSRRLFYLPKIVEMATETDANGREGGEIAGI